MKKLIVFYSFEGNTRFIAKSIAKAIKADILEIKPLEEIKTKGFMKYFWGGKQATMKETPELRPFKKNPGKYGIIFIGTPVWAFTFAPPIRTFFSKHKLQNKRIALFATHEGHLLNTLEKMENGLKGNIIIGKADFTPALGEREKCAEKATKWARSII